MEYGGRRNYWSWALFHDRRRKRYLLFNRNESSLPPLCHLRLGAGRAMVGALCAQLLGQPHREMPPVMQQEMIAYFPQAWTCKSEFLQSSFQDIPEGEPELIQEMLHPWSERSLVGRTVDFLRRFTGGERTVENYVCRNAITDPDLTAGRRVKEGVRPAGDWVQESHT